MDSAWIRDKIWLAIDHWKAILAATVVLFVAGTSAVLLTRSAPTFTSRMVVPLKPSARAILASAPAGAMSLAEIAPGSGLYQVSASGPTPQAAKQQLEKMLAQVMSATMPSASDRAIAAKRIDFLNASIDDLRRVAQRLNEQISHPAPGTEVGTAASGLAAVMAAIASLEGQLDEAKVRSLGLRAEDIPWPPTLPGAPDANRFGTPTLILAVLAASFALSVLMTVLFFTLRPMVWSRPNF
jgi:hypothetical protein